MPWREKSPVDLRVQFISEYMSDWFTMTELAAQYGISRKTAYKWVDALRSGGARGRWGIARGGRTSIRRRRPRRWWRPCCASGGVIRSGGPRSCWRWGAGSSPTPRGRVDRPCVICCRRHGLIVPRRRRRPEPHGSHAPGARITAPNETWTTDFKGEFRTGDRAYCYPLTLRDGFSRYVLRCDALRSRTYRGDAASLRARVRRVWAARADPQRQWDPVCRAGPGAACRG